mgnify:FL=1
MKNATLVSQSRIPSLCMIDCEIPVIWLTPPLESGFLADFIHFPNGILNC